MSATISARLVRVLLLTGTAFGLAAAPAAAQVDDGDIDSVSQPVVQPLPGGPGMQLNNALGKLARNPRDVDALIEAGRASAAIGDPEAAMGFFRRADQLQPANANIKAGLAGAMVLAEDPFAAIPLFEQAEQIGPIDPKLLSERGLAYDLVGDNELAQRFYRQALAAGPDDETLRRLALSQAISGDRRGMEVTLSPLLQKQDKAAWRTRAFAFAILGLAAEAEAIARANLPEATAGGMVAYLRYMPRLTPAQQAAASNLGHFPRAAEIGRDDPRVAAFARPKAALAAADKPIAAPAGRSDRTVRPRGRTAVPDAKLPATSSPPAPVRVDVRPAPPEPQPVKVAVAPARAPVQAAPANAQMIPASTATASGPGFMVLDGPKPQAAPVLAAVTPASAALPQATQELPTVAARPPAPEPEPAPAPAPAPTVVSTPAPAPAPAAAPARPRRLADVFADLAPPSREAEPVAGAVDLRKIAAARAKAEADAAKAAKAKEAAKSPAVTQPSRIWVQLAASRDKAGLAGDLRRFVRSEPELLKGRKGFTSAWGQATRLLIGPFPNEKAAATLLAQLKKAGITDGFVWTSPAGQVVDPIPTSK